MYHATIRVVQGSALSRVAASGAAVLAAAILGIDDFGAYTFAIMTAALVSGLGQMSMPVLVTRDIAQSASQQERAQLLTGGLVVVLGGTAAMGVVGFPLAASVGGGAVTDVLGGVGWLGAALLAVGGSITVTILAFHHGTGDFSTWRRLTVAKGLAEALALVGVLTLTRSAAISLWASGLASAGVALFGVWDVRRVLDYRDPPTTGRLLRQMKAVAGPGLANGAVAAANWALQVALLNAPGGLAVTGAFGLAARFSQIGLFLPAAYIGAATPGLLATGRDGRSEFEFRIETKVMALAGVSAVGLMLLSPSVLLLGSEYSAAVIPTLILGAAVLPTAGNVLVGQMALSRHLVRAWWLSDLALAGALAFLGIALTTRYSASGAALAVLLAFGLSWLGLRAAVLSHDRRRPIGDIVKGVRPGARQ